MSEGGKEYPLVIGFAGRSRSGKDTLGTILLEEFEYGRRFAYADELRRVTLRLWDLTWAQLTAEKDLPDARWGLTPRQILQRFGTGVVRQVHPDTWVRFLLDFSIPQHSGSLAVVTDVRYPNEAEGIRRRGGFVIRVVRRRTSRFMRFLMRWPKVYVAWCTYVLGQHDSEAWSDVIPVDAEIVNDGDLAALRSKLLASLEYTPDKKITSVRGGRR